MVLQAWGTWLVQPADDGVRERIVQHLSASEEKGSVLIGTIGKLEAGNSLEQVRLTQQAWLQASTKDDCQYLFALVSGLLPGNPELCLAFYDAFRWVDMFSNGYSWPDRALLGRKDLFLVVLPLYSDAHPFKLMGEMGIMGVEDQQFLEVPMEGDFLSRSGGDMQDSVTSSLF